MSGKHYIGIFEGHFDPAVAIVSNGKVIAYAEEERFTRYKHAYRIYPIRALKYCLSEAGLGPEDVAAIGVNWDAKSFDDGSIAAYFDRMGKNWTLDAGTLSWQRSMLANFNLKAIENRHARHWHRAFGNIQMPPVHTMQHHFVHAFHAYRQSPYEDALCITIDGSGDTDCTVLWSCRGDSIKRIREIGMPHSLGWLYAGITEYLGFDAYNGEYKVMGLAAYGKAEDDVAERVSQILQVAPDGVEYRIDPKFIHYGPHTYSERFTDHLPELLGRPPRLQGDPIDSWHQNLAFAIQRGLEEAVCRLVEWGVSEAGTKNLCVGGGVGLNVKMNSRLFQLDTIERIYPHPLCSDGGSAAGAALAACWDLEGAAPEELRTLALGTESGNDEVERALKLCGLRYEKVENIAEKTAGLLANGNIIGWFQGRMEAGPRALGQRSILADPRTVEVRDKVNAIIKYREYWRPFCPSMLAEYADRYLVNYDDAGFMIIAFDATEELKKDAPAVVHVDGTSRVQLVHREVLPLYYRLIESFAEITGVPVLLNTSFNVKGEPIVCTIQDAIRTFFSSGLHYMAAGNFLVSK